MISNIVLLVAMALLVGDEDESESEFFTIHRPTALLYQ
jgi:hypothetical protein